MFDNRKALERGYRLDFGGGHIFTVEEEIGRGASCMAYGGAYSDGAGLRHLVRIKECCPYNMELGRAQDGSIRVPQAYAGQFSAAKEKFHSAYARNVELKNQLGIMNSTVEALGIFEKNQTLYTVAGIVEGADYRGSMDGSLQSVFTRMLSLARLLQKYHAQGLLHLDIKPENLLMIPETKEHIVLFDFDSLIPLVDLMGGEGRISFSDGYSAPELVRGDRKRIGMAADVYSLGAIVFRKLFGRTPNVMDCSISARYDYGKLVFGEERYRHMPELLREISYFLHKTISSSVAYRFKDMAPVIGELEKLIRLSDVEAVDLCHSFEPSLACFVGRRKELEEIGGRLAEQHTLFLSGIGGIGKTELAKRFAGEQQDSFRRVAFLPFQGSVLDTVISPELRIQNFMRAEEETDQEFFERKLEMLRAVASPQDLIILDNFDVAADENLESLLLCPCKFLITTREDYRDYGYAQLTVGKLTRLEELVSIFRAYNVEEYGEEESRSIEAMIELVERHTMTVDLLAKYLRNTGEAPSRLLGRLLEKEGITAVEVADVKHRKDRRLREESVDRHLRILFDLSGFTAEECELIGSLSLLGYVRIARAQFLELCGLGGGEEILANLVRQGWIEYEEASGKVSLHQIILDLVYNHLKPTSEACPRLVAAMTGYMGQELENNVDRKNQKKLLGFFAERLVGADYRYAEFLVSYCEQFGNRVDYLEAAENILHGCGEQGKYDLLQRICICKIEVAAACGDRPGWGWDLEEIDFEEDAGEPLEAQSFAQYYEGVSQRIRGLAEEAYGYARQFTADAGYLGRFCVKLAWKLERAITDGLSFDAYVEEVSDESLCRILDYAAELLEEGEGFILASGLDRKEKLGLLIRSHEFFTEEDIEAMYRVEHYADPERAYHYQEVMEGLKEEDELIVYQEVGLEERVYRAEQEGDYEKVVSLYQEAYEKGEDIYASYKVAFNCIAEAYRKMGNNREAIRYLEKILEYDSSYYDYSPNSCLELIRLLAAEGEAGKAEQYAWELIRNNREAAGEDPDHISWVLAGYYEIYLLASEPEGKERAWGECEKCMWALEEKEEWGWELEGFLLEYASKKKEKKEGLQFIFHALEKLEKWRDLEKTERFLTYVAGQSDGERGLEGYHILALLRLAELCLDLGRNETGRAWQYCMEAQERYREGYGSYLGHYIHKVLAEYYGDLENGEYKRAAQEREKCDYYLLAEYDADRRFPLLAEYDADKKLPLLVDDAAGGKPLEKRVDIWKDAARLAERAKKWDMQVACCQKAVALLEPLLSQCGGLEEWGILGYHTFSGLYIDMLKAYGRMQKENALLGQAMKFCRHICRYYGGSCAEEENKAERFSMDLWQVGQCLAEGGREKEALLFCLLSVIAAIDPARSGEVLAAAEDFLAGDADGLCGEFGRAIHSTAAPAQIDWVVGVWDTVRPAMQGKGEWEEFEEGFRWFTETYQDRDVEFKR